MIYIKSQSFVINLYVDVDVVYIDVYKKHSSTSRLYTCPFHAVSVRSPSPLLLTAYNELLHNICRWENITYNNVHQIVKNDLIFRLCRLI